MSPARPRSRPATLVSHALAGILALMAILLHLAYVRFDDTIPHNDDTNLYAMSLCFEDALTGAGPRDFHACVPGTPYPFLIPLLAALHFLTTDDRSIRMAVTSLWPWYALLVIGLYAAVRREAGELAGLAAAAVGVGLAWSFELRGSFFTEVPMMALVVAALAAWMATRGFRDPLACLLLGVLISLGLLTKWTVGFFLGPPLTLYACLTLFRLGSSWRTGAPPALLGLSTAGFLALAVQKASLPALQLAVVCTAGLLGYLGFSFWWRRSWLSHDAPRQLLGLSLTVAVILLLVLPWYVPELPHLQRFLRSNLEHQYEGEVVGWQVAWPYYPSLVFKRAMGTPLLLLFLLGCARLCFPRRSPLALSSLAVAFSGLALLTAFPYRTSRYILPMLGPLIPVMFTWIRETLPTSEPRPGWPALLTFLRHQPRGRALWRIPLLSLALAGGLFYQVSWIEDVGRSLYRPFPRAPWAPPPPYDRGGLSDVLRERTRELFDTRFRLSLQADPPRPGQTASRRLVAALAQRTPPGVPYLAVLLNPTCDMPPNELWVRRVTTAPPRGSRVMARYTLDDEASLRATLLQASDQSWAVPGTVESHGGWNGQGRLPANLFVITLWPLAPQPALERSNEGSLQKGPLDGRWSPVLLEAESDEFQARLRGLGLKVVTRDVQTYARPCVMRLWAVDSARAVATGSRTDAELPSNRPGPPVQNEGPPVQNEGPPLLRRPPSPFYSDPLNPLP